MTDGDHLVERSANRWALAVVAAIVLLLAVAIGLGRRSDEPVAAPDPTAATGAATTTTSTTVVDTSTTVAPEPDRERLAPAWPTGPAVSLTPGAPPLDGRVALAPWPDGGLPDEEPLWIVDGGSTTARFDLRTHPGDWPYPILFLGDAVALVDQNGNVQLMSADGAQVTTLRLEDPARYLVPASTRGDVWAVHDDFDLTLVSADGSTTPVATGDDIGWIVTGVADGVVAMTATEPVVPVYVPTGGAATTIESLTDPPSFVIGASGDLIAVFEPGPSVTVIDVRTDERVAEVPVPRTALRACFSADRSHLAVGDHAGDSPITIIDLAAGRLFERWPDDHFGDMAWASDTELVVMDGNRLVRFDTDGGGEGIGLVTGPTWRSGTSATAWWIASERAPC